MSGEAEPSPAPRPMDRRMERRIDRRVVGTIFAKELRDTLRDRRTLVTMLLVPAVVYPAAMLIGAETMGAERSTEASPPVRVQVMSPAPPRLVDHLGAASALEVVVAPPPLGAVADAASAALVETADVVIWVAPGDRDALEGVGTAEVVLFWDATRPQSEARVTRVRERLEELRRGLVAERLEGAGLPPTAALPFTLEVRSAAPAEKLSAHLLASVLPALILIFVAMACFYPAVDLTAGEKERRTLSTLLTAPVTALEIVLGKYFAVLTVGTLAGLANVAAMSVTLLQTLAAAAPEGLQVVAPGPLTLAGLLATTLLAAAPVAALMLFTAMFARSFRDANHLLTPVLVLIVLPSLAASTPTASLSLAWSLVPLANTVLLMRGLLSGPVGLLEVLSVTASSLLVTGALLLLVARVFADERVLFSTEGKRADLRGILTSPPPFGPSTALAFTGVVFLVQFYGGLLAVAWPPLLVVAGTQILGHLLPSAGLAAWLRPRRLLPRLGAPPSVWAGGALVGAGAWLGVSLPALWLVAALAPDTGEAARRLAEALAVFETHPALLLLVLAILPGVAEELAFRGVVFRLLAARMSPRAALLLQAAIFGAMHGSLHRFLPTALLGWVLGWVVQRSGSLGPAMLAHASTNAILLGIERFGPDTLRETLGAPSLWPLAGLGMCALGFALLGEPRRPAPAQPGPPDSARCPRCAPSACTDPNHGGGAPGPSPRVARGGEVE